VRLGGVSIWPRLRDAIHPELKRAPTDDDRRRIYREAMRACRASRGRWIGKLTIETALGGAWGLVVARGLFAIQRSGAGWLDDSLIVLGLLVGGLGVSVIAKLLSRPILRRSVRAALDAQGLPTCAGCGYDLHGSPDADRCPECGESRDRGSIHA